MFTDGTIRIADPTDRQPKLTVLASGDFCPLGRPEAILLEGRAEAVLADYAELAKTADIAIVNLEAPLTRADNAIVKTGPNLKLNPACVDLLRAGGVNAVSLANNHLGDFGTDPVLETLDHLDDAGILHCGAGRSLDHARQPLVLDREDFRVAFLNYAENEFGGASSDTPGTSTLDPLANLAQIRCAAETADAVLVVVHGGNEHNPLPSPRMRQLYRAFADAGAAAVIGHHTHCPQGIEVWNGTPIVYSLGNLLFDPSFIHPDYDPTSFWWVGYSARLSLDAEGVLSVDVLPHTFAPDATRLRLFSNNHRREFLDHLAGLSKRITDDRDMRRHWETWSAHAAPEVTSYFRALTLPPTTKDELRTALVARNTYTCEAHHETMTSFFRLIEEGRLEQAQQRWSEVPPLQQAPRRWLKAGQVPLPAEQESSP